VDTLQDKTALYSYIEEGYWFLIHYFGC